MSLVLVLFQGETVSIANPLGLAQLHFEIRLETFSQVNLLYHLDQDLEK